MTPTTATASSEFDTLPPPRPRFPVVYVAGPFRAATPYKVRLNIRRAEAVALELFKLGAVAVCVHTMCANFERELPDDTWLALDLELLARSDALYLVPGWEESVGTAGEIDFATAHGQPVFQDFNQIANWIKLWNEAGRRG